MLQSPPKRRKTSSNTSIAVGTRSDGLPAPSNQTTPTRASYLSPTKASLARSHPNLLAKSPSRPEPSTRGRNLREELLGRRREQPNASQNQPSAAGAAHGQQADTHPDNQPTSVSTIAVSSRPSEIPISNRSTPQLAGKRREPVFQRPRQGRSPSEDLVQSVMVPQLVQRQNSSQNLPDRPGNNDPELPPTPVQLGLDVAPGRPRGLASSSSPGGSKSGSGKDRKRRRGNGVSSSPLKPRANPPGVSVEETESPATVQHRTVPAMEAPESGVEVPESTDAAFAEDPRQKQTTIDDLKAQVECLEAEMRQLEGSLSQPSLLTDEELLTLLAPENETAASTNHLRPMSPIHPYLIDLEPRSLSYLTIFAPGPLRLQSRSRASRSKEKGRTTMHHTVQLTAPPPWPMHIFGGVFEVVNDVHARQIRSLKFKPIRRGSSDELTSWIQSRISSRLHRFDVSSLVWAMGRYFEKMVERACVMEKLDQRLNANSAPTSSGHETDASADNQAATAISDIKEMRALAPYLGMKQLECRCRTAASPEAKLMLNFDLSPDWTGEIHSQTKLVASHLPPTAQGKVVSLFESLKVNVGIVDAVLHIARLLSRGEISV